MAKFSVDTSEVELEKLGTGGRPLPGKCQLLITGFEPKDGYFSVEHEIVAHEKASEVGKTSYNSFGLDGNSAKRTLEFLIAVGAMTKEQAIESGGAIDFDSDDLLGKVYFGKLEVSTYNGKDKCRVEWDFFNVSSDKCEGFPFDPKLTPANSPARKAAPKDTKSAPKNERKTQPKKPPTENVESSEPEADIPF